jgi:hypothetical protein
MQLETEIPNTKEELLKRLNSTECKGLYPVYYTGQGRVNFTHGLHIENPFTGVVYGIFKNPVKLTGASSVGGRRRGYGGNYINPTQYVYAKGSVGDMNFLGGHNDIEEVFKVLEHNLLTM